MSETRLELAATSGSFTPGNLVETNAEGEFVDTGQASVSVATASQTAVTAAGSSGVNVLDGMFHLSSYVTDFSGASDMTTQFQAAVTAAAALYRTTGRPQTIYWDVAGTVQVSTVTWASGVSLRSPHYSLSRIQGTSQTTPAINGQGFTYAAPIVDAQIEGIDLDGSTATLPGSYAVGMKGVAFSPNGRNVAVRRCHVHDWGATGIATDSATEGCHVQDNLVVNNGRGARINVTVTSISGNVLTVSSSTSGMVVGEVVSGFAGGLTAPTYAVAGNYPIFITAVSGGSITLSVPPTGSAGTCTVSVSPVVNGDGGASGIGIGCANSGNTTTLVPPATTAAQFSQEPQIISGNVCIGNTHYGIFHEGQSTTAAQLGGGVLVTDNICYGNYTGIGLCGTFGEVCSGNTCWGNANFGIGVDYGTLERNTSRDTLITGNTCYDNCTANIGLDLSNYGTGTVTQPGRQTVTNNVCFGGQNYGIALYVGTTNLTLPIRIKGNTISYAGQGGIQVLYYPGNGSTSTAANVDISDNQVYDSGFVSGNSSGISLSVPLSNSWVNDNLSFNSTGVTTQNYGLAVHAAFTGGSIKGNDFRNNNTGVMFGGTNVSATTIMLANDGLDSATLELVAVAGPATRSATVIVAASDATASEKLQADYVCDGTADDVQLNAALSSLTTGGTLRLSSGQFNLTEPLVFTQSSQTVKGAGMGIAVSGGVFTGGTLLNLASGATCGFTWQGTTDLWFCSVRDLAIESGTYGLYFPYNAGFTFWDFWCRDVTVSGCTSDGFNAYDGHGFVLDHFIAEQTGGWAVNFPTANAQSEPEVRNGTYKVNGGGGIFMGCPGGVVAENEFESITGTAIVLQGAGSKATDNTIGETGTGASGVGIELNGAGAIAKGNYVANCGSYGIELFSIGCTCIGNYLTLNTGANIYATQPGSLVVANYCLYGSSYGIEVNTPGNVAVIGNYVQGAALAGIYINAAANCTVQNNILRQNVQQGILSNSTGTTISGNTLYSSSNTTANSYDEISCSGNNAVVTGNTINGNSKSRYGINFSGSATTGNICSNNTVSGTETASYGASTYNVIWSPATILAKTGSYSLAAIDTTAVFTISGAATATLPSAVTAGSGRPYTITNANASSSSLTIAATAGTTPVATLAAGASLRVISDGANWQAC